MENNAFLWRRILQLAKEVHELAPWDWLHEDDIFGVRVPETGELYFISILGSAGEFNAITAYKGSRALGMFWEIYSREYGRLAAERIMTIPHIMLSFGDRNMLRPEQLEIIRESGIKFRGSGSWPLIDETVPGYVPVMPGDESLYFMVDILEQVLDVAGRAEKDAGFILPEECNDNTYLIREKSETDGVPAWMDKYREIEADNIDYRVEVSKETIRDLDQLPMRTGTLQLDLVMIPAPVKDDASPGYFPFMLLLCNKKSGIVEGMETLPPKPDLDTMYQTLPQKVAGIEMIKSNKLESIDEAVESLFNSL
jgi:hypothetical protein